MKIFGRILDSRLRDIVEVSQNQCLCGSSPRLCTIPTSVHPLHGHDFIDLQSTTPWTLLYADDVMIAASTREKHQQKVQAWKDRLEQYGMRLNVKKTEYVECGEQTPGKIFVDDAEPPKASAFKYLGSRISADGSTLVEAEYRANAAWGKWRQPDYCTYVYVFPQGTCEGISQEQGSAYIGTTTRPDVSALSPSSEACKESTECRNREVPRLSSPAVPPIVQMQHFTAEP
ncbi:hypothetical protein Y032_0792g2374 [Ancylostoma ceylanicum]|uniref:Reverse transcriptase domain-containing protein n=2 Tax=Ancylostoma ceylanicum TaxID=53326 RepID=A0A016WCR2_9BILA|nr:hypothetical protein Y032_0792g2374 [Ancylostoma ceylanicum]